MSEAVPTQVRVVDSHTEGEPTRVVVDGGPDLSGATMAERRDTLSSRHDGFRRSIVLEPRGFEAIVGALLTAPVEEASVAGVVFFNDVGYLGMCGHGLIGVVRTLEYLGRISAGTVRIDTPVGTVTAKLDESGAVSVTNVASFRHLASVRIDVDIFGEVVGDVAYGGNWFFLARGVEPILELTHVDYLLAKSKAIRSALVRMGIAGSNAEAIEHIELFGLPRDRRNDSRNFVLCPGAAYDRSPCGTGTSAKLACLAADGKLGPGVAWRQESVVGSTFEASYSIVEGDLIPTIKGHAFVTSDATLVFDPRDPFRQGISGR